MQNPLEQQVPEDKMQQVEHFARDYAYCVLNELCEPSIVASTSLDGVERWDGWGSGSFFEHTKDKWKSHPSIWVLTVLGYFEETKQGRFTITDKAFKLLENPITIPTIFISYGHEQSSALALLIEARLKYADSQIGVFIDKSITPGDEWHAHLQEQVEASEYLVCLLGQSLTQDNDGNVITKTTIASPYVRQEIQWALDAKKTIIFICHDGYHLPSEQGELDEKTWEIIQALSTKQGIFVDAESAEEYEFAVNKLLNALGYATY